MGMNSAGEIAALLGCSRQWVYGLHDRRDSNGFPAGQGAPLRWNSADVIAWKRAYQPALGGAPTSVNTG